MTITHQEKEVEHLYDYLCWYLGYWIQPPPVEDIAKDLQITLERVTELLAQLERANRIHPGSTMPKGCLGGTGLIPKPGM